MRRRRLLELAPRAPRGQLLRGLVPIDSCHVVPQTRVDGLLLLGGTHEPHGFRERLVIEINLGHRHRTPPASMMYIPTVHHQHRGKAIALRITHDWGRGSVPSMQYSR